MTNIASNVYNEYPPPPENRYWGLVKLEEVRTVCWRPTCVQPQCHVKLSSDCELAPVRDEVIRLNVAGQLGLGERCIVPVQGEEELHLEVTVCNGVDGGWLYQEDNYQMKYIVKYQDEEGNNKEMTFCVEMRGLGGALVLTQCNNEEKKQKWIWDEYKPYWA